MSLQYILGTPTLAVAVHPHGKTVVTLPTASLIDVPDALESQDGLIGVGFNGETVLMFAQDIRERGRLVSSASG